MDLRPHLPIHGHGTMMAAKGQGVDAAPVKLIALDLDPATVVDDESFLPLIGKEKNLPDFLKEGLPKLYH